VEEVLFRFGLCILNKGNDPTFQTSLAATCIDITVASPALGSLVKNWKVSTEKHMSDHYQITDDLQVRPDIMPLRHGRNLMKADWAEFQKIVKNIFLQYEDPILWSPSQIEKSVAFVQNAMTTGLDAVAKLSPYRPKKAIFSWWNLDLDQLQELTCMGT
jgi:hypothetical protein